jgi:hypothetical protein
MDQFWNNFLDVGGIELINLIMERKAKQIEAINEYLNGLRQPPKIRKSKNEPLRLPDDQLPPRWHSHWMGHYP